MSGASEKTHLTAGSHHEIPMPHVKMEGTTHEALPLLGEWVFVVYMAMKLQVAFRLSSIFIASCWCTTAAVEYTCVTCIEAVSIIEPTDFIT